MSDLCISFNGMVLIGHGERAEAWLIDTDRVRIGHDRRHEIRIGRETRVLQGHVAAQASNEVMNFVGHLPVKTMSDADLLRRLGSVTLTDPVTVCPNGAKRL